MRLSLLIPRYSAYRRTFLSFVVLLLVVQLAAAETIFVEISGTYSEVEQQFSGTAVFSLPLPPANRVFFHLPPQWHIAVDERTTYQLQLSGSGSTPVERSDLISILPPGHENIHLPAGIQVSAVTVNNRDSEFRITNNAYIAPAFNSIDSLLEVPLRESESNGSVTIQIAFLTRFNPLSSGYKRLLWDFIPRPVAWSEGRWDFRGARPPMMRQTISIRQTGFTDVSGNQINEAIYAPVTAVLLNNWDYQDRNLRVSFDSYFAKEQLFLLSRIVQVEEFLKQFSVFSGDGKQLRVVFWDGPLSVSGIYVLLPRRLFRYPFIFYKQFEITLLRGIIKALMLRRYDIDTLRYPWMLPAIQSEITRRYFKDRFAGNTFMFPWLDWINPEYFRDVTVSPWVENLSEKDICGADLPADLEYFPQIHHPGNEKGAHLLWMLHDGKQQYRRRLVARIFDLLNRDPGDKRERLTPAGFFRSFSGTRRGREMGQQWLSEDGRVDYAIDNVTISRISNQNKVILDIRNNGSLSPRLEVGFYFPEDQKRILAVSGAGRFEFFFENEPEQIILDPHFNILDDNPVNNRWRFPLRTRLIWDFAPPDIWLFTVSPLVGEANTFDRNILGLNLMVSYMSRTIFQLNFWKGSSSSLLWSGEIQHIGFPDKGTELYLKTGYIGAVNSTSVGYKKNMFRGYPGLMVEATFWKEKLDEMDGDEFENDQLDWTGATVQSEFPLFQHALHLWQINILARTGFSLFSPHTEYQQLMIDQNLRYSLGTSDLHLGYRHGFSSGSVPLQHQYPMGGTEGLAGFPRKTELLYSENRILELGATLPPVLTHTDINLLGLMWLNRIVPALDFHYGQGLSEESGVEEFRDVELTLSLEGEFINRFKGEGRFGIAQPIESEKYKDYRLILFTDWVF